MQRIIDQPLQEWRKESSRKPLIVRGARQVGKTFSVKALGASSFQETIVVDFERQPQLKAIFESDLDVHRIIDMIGVEFNTSVEPGKTLLFLDEVQHCPRALASLRYFFEDLPQLHVIAAGSMLESQMEKVPFPVGRVESIFMYPLTFHEFLTNTNNQKLTEYLPSLIQDEPVADFIHNKLLEELKRYFIVGGMPEAVSQYHATGSLQAVSKVHKSLYESYQQDILKHEKNLELDSIAAVLEAIPKHVGKQIKYSKLYEGLTLYKTKAVLRALEKALLVHPVRSSGANGLPLGADVNKTIIKAAFLDIGLMQYICGIPANVVLTAEDLLDTYNGALCEQFIGQELIARGGSQHGSLFYWSRMAKNSNAEVDYLNVREGSILPIEVKNGPAGKLRSLHLFLKEHPDIPAGYVLNTGNVASIGKIQFRPLYTQLKK